MVSLKPLTVSLLFFFWELQIASGVNFLTARTSTKKPDDECPSDEEEHRVNKRQPRQPIDVRNISAEIWDSRRRGINVQYNNPVISRLFQRGYVDSVLSSLFQYYNKNIGQLDPCQIQGPQRTNCQLAQTAFINAISNENRPNGPIHVLYQWLSQEGHFTRNYQAFKDELKRIWFTPYSRSGNIRILDSSGFEHVFLGEIKTTQNRRGQHIICVSGFHNWMRMWREETNRNFALAPIPNYQAHGNIVASVDFEWNGSRPKPSSFFMETSLATEIALYTLCFMTQPGNVCNIELDNNPLRLQTYRMSNAGLIGSAFPLYP